MPGAGNLVGRRIEVDAMRADGSLFPAELAISRVDVPGAPVFTAALRDISKRTDAEERLRAAEFRYRTLVEQLPLITYVDRIDDPRSTALYVSPQVETVFGYSPDEWLALPDLFQRLVHPDDRERVLAEKLDAYARKETLRHVYRMRAQDGHLVWLEDVSVHVDPPEGMPAFRQGFALDITERKRADDAVRSAETRYRTLVEQLPLAMYVDRVDASSSNVYTSPQIESMLGYSVEEWRADPLLFVELLHPDDRERVLAAHERTHATGEPLHTEYRLHASDGRVVWVHDEARIIDDPESGGAVLQGYLLDITARREAEEQLRHQAFHDPLTGSRTGRSSPIAFSTRSSCAPAPPPSSSSISTTSRPSTTALATSRATRCSPPPAPGFAPLCPRASRWRAWEGTSSRSSSRQPTERPPRSKLPRT